MPCSSHNHINNAFVYYQILCEKQCNAMRILGGPGNQNRGSMIVYEHEHTYTPLHVSFFPLANLRQSHHMDS